LYEKIGFKVEGREREAYWHEGRWWDGVELGMLEGEWRSLKEGRIRKDEEGEK
jgi:RimJ/RimL family protein N-acetyltransferase